MESNESINIKRILEIALSKNIIAMIILILVASVTLGYVYSYYYKIPQYKSSVTILLVGDEENSDKQVTQTELSLNSSLISTYSNIAKSTNVTEKTVKNLGIDMPISVLQNNIEVTQISNTQFLKISVKTTKPELSRDIVKELAKVFTREIKEIYNLKNINIVDEAEIDENPCNMNHIKDMVIAIVIGVILSSMLVMVVYILDETIKDEKDIEQILEVRSLGTLPINKDKNKLITETDPKSHVVEALKTIRTNILYSTNKKVILMTSTKEKEGTSWIIDNIAVTFAQTGKKVILVDTNLRRQTDKNQVFNISATEGLSDFIKEISGDKLEDLENAQRYIKETNIPNLHILTNGTIPPNPSELISSNNMKKLLVLLKNMYDIVLLDGISCTSVSDSIALSTMVDDTILIVENKKVKIKDLKKVKKSIENVDGKILGVILNKVEEKKGKYYGKKYGYYYGKEDLEEKEKLQENKTIVSLAEIIKTTEEKIKTGLIEREYIDELEEIEITEEDNNFSFNDKIKREIGKIKDEIFKFKRLFTQLKRDNERNRRDINKDIEELRQNQINDKIELMQKIESINYNEQFARIDKKIQENDNMYINQFAAIDEKIQENNNMYINQLAAMDEKIQDDNNIYKNEFEELDKKVKENNYKYNEELVRLQQEVIQNKYEEKELQSNYNEELARINELIKQNNAEHNEQLMEINERIDKNNYDDVIAKINYKLQENSIKQREQLQIIMEKIEQNSYGEELTRINEKMQQDNYAYGAQLAIIMEKLEQNNYGEELAKINEKIQQNNYEYKEQLEAIKERLEHSNYEEELNKIKAKMQEDNNQYKEQIAKIEEKIELNKEIEKKSKVDNIIKFEELKEKRSKKSKREFSFDEDINFEDLERLSTCVIDIKDDNTESFAIN